MQATTSLSPTLAMAGLLLLPLSALAADPAPGNVLTVGGGAAVVSSYSGSDKLSTMPLVAIDYAMANGFFASTMRGIGYGGQAGPLSYSLALGYRGERTDHKRNGINGYGGSDYLKGMGDVKGNASALLGMAYSPIPGVQLSVSSDIPLNNRDNGARLQFGAGGQIYSKNDSQGVPQDTVSLGVQTGWGEKKYMQTMYGVSASQASNTAFKQYTPKGGFYEAQATVSWEHRFDAKWGLTAMAGVTSLIGDARKSPIVQRKTAPVGAIYATYRY
ncbi:MULTISPECIES: MipA/OmpV family protein [unclassified Janthinobacterium]|uniref:MipA/OmpV family protein n=1 Tax=unclassified Janthinobacterium TaxID=2610881 RepID=UPI00161045E7|nr:MULTISPECIES: MipA/OmpV family protein [unclassified Janthinobacterium]MBB5367743.1 outer membrane scaffolding protein for murein synthesis (MipA/OmpV family) [Janthinobacterium sp. K2C7]MBB5379779.1 outer membrane scaffolding protein for murein synthesis (MipA/OmpV family) [Janthinobacterium sp. K2Li3]MBB5386125.1 outer membrane scaffolding protein for murein synthesis (MipA/OmpV family) [Janthinobacterium sp. K2E3]